MKLETEFRLYEQRQQLERQLYALLRPQLEPTPSTWVKLVPSIAAEAGDEALLLCQCGDSQWLAWMPEQGEIVLNTDQIADFA